MLQFLFFLLIFIIFFTILMMALSYHYALYFDFDKTLKYHFAVSVLFLQLIFKADSERQFFLIKVFKFKKEIMLAEENKLTNFIENKSKKIIKKKLKNKTAPDSKIKKEKSKEKSKFKFNFSLINRENLNHIFKFILEMINFLKMDYLKLSLVFSFADPYYNGVFLAYFYTFKELFDYPDLKAQINWQEVVFEAEGSAGGKIVPLQIIYHFLKFIFSIKTLKILWQLYQSNSKKG